MLIALTLGVCKFAVVEYKLRKGDMEMDGEPAGHLGAFCEV